MVFNSFDFLIFFIIVYVLYCNFNYQWQNRLLLLSSGIFYAYWDWRFLSLLIFSTYVAYTCGNQIILSKDVRRKKLFLILAILINLSLLAFFKYFNFFIVNFQLGASALGIQLPLNTLNIILPLGISFYTFQTLSFVFDAFNGQIRTIPRRMDFALFASFFPQLVAGPIERAKDLLVQIESRRQITSEKIEQGSYLLLWGFFLKVFAADNLARIVNPIFDAAPPYNGIAVLLATYGFSFQIYCDFAGYSSIACGLAKLMGFNLMDNFNLPFFSTNIQDFWRRWHISLMSWFKDYVYIPLGGNRVFIWRQYFNIILVFLLSGLWHGAQWNFIYFGAYHGVLMVGYHIYKRYFSKIKDVVEKTSGVIFLVKVIIMFHLIAFGFMLFRAKDMYQIMDMSIALLQNFHFNDQLSLFGTLKMTGAFVGYVSLIIGLEWLQLQNRNLRAVIHLPWFWQGIVYFLLLFLLITFGVGGGKEFIYFQF